MISLRFTGGPLDGRTHPTRTPAYEYRIVGGVYRRGRTLRPSTDDEPVIVYVSRPEEAGRWQAPLVEVVDMW